MTPKADRAALATALKAALPEGWAAFPAPPEVPSVPCVVIGPGSPYRQLLTYTKQAMRLRLTVLLNRAVGQDALDAIDDAIDDVIAALDAASDAVPNDWSGVEATGLVDVGGVEYLAATIDVAVY